MCRKGILHVLGLCGAESGKDVLQELVGVSRTVPPRDSGTHHPPSGMHKLSRHYRNASRDLRDVGTPLKELMHSSCFGT